MLNSQVLCCQSLRVRMSGNLLKNKSRKEKKEKSKGALMISGDLGVDFSEFCSIFNDLSPLLCGSQWKRSHSMCFSGHGFFGQALMF